MVVAIVTSLGIPVFCLVTRSVETLRLDRARVAAEEICHATVERYGRAQDHIQRLLSPSPEDPKVLEGKDLFKKVPEVYEEMKLSHALDIASKIGLSMDVRLQREVEPGLDVLSCRVSWIKDRQGERSPGHVVYIRFLLHDHLH